MQHRIPPSELTIEVDNIPKDKGAESKSDEGHLHTVRNLDVRHSLQQVWDEDDKHHQRRLKHLEGYTADRRVILQKEEGNKVSEQNYGTEDQDYCGKLIQFAFFH